MKSSNRIVTSLTIVAAAVVGLSIWYALNDCSLRDSDSVVLAMFPVGKDERGYTDAEIIDAINRLGNPNGFSEVHRTSFITAACCAGRSAVVSWLLENGASPLPRGEQPLFASVRRGDIAMSRKLLQAGATLSGPASDNTTIKDWIAEHRPDMLSKLED